MELALPRLQVLCCPQQQVWLVPVGPCSDTLLPWLSLPWDVLSRDQVLLLCLQGAKVIVIIYQILKYFFLFFSSELGFLFLAAVSLVLWAVCATLSCLILHFLRSSVAMQ